VPRTTVSALALITHFAVITSGCTSSRPALYPNHHYQAAGKVAAERDIEECMHLAEQYGASEGRSSRAASNAAGAAAVGGAAGAAAGAVRGDMGQTAAAGAAAAGAASVTRSLIKSGEPDSVYKSFVNKCLRDKGYEPLGWK